MLSLCAQVWESSTDKAEPAGHSETSPSRFHISQNKFCASAQMQCLKTIRPQNMLRLLHIFKFDTVFILDSWELFFETRNSAPSFTARIQQNKFIICILCAEIYHSWNLEPLYNIIAKGYVINLFPNPPQNVKRYICVLAATVWRCGICLWKGCGILTF